MAEMGKWQRGKALRKLEQGMMVSLPPLEVLIPRKYVPADLAIGQEIEVFLFRDSEDRPTAIPIKPKAELGQWAYVEIKEITPFGAFADWGLPKDLLIPHKEMDKPLTPGEKVLIKVQLDPNTDRLYGSVRAQKFLFCDTSELEIGQKGLALIYASHPLGYSAVFENSWQGLFYTNEVFEKLNLGDVKDAYIKNIREDGKLDLSLRPLGFENTSKEAREIILTAMKRLGGFLDLQDKSDPEEIRSRLGLSKKIFKATVGILYKEKIITIEENGIRLIV